MALSIALALWVFHVSEHATDEPERRQYFIAPSAASPFGLEPVTCWFDAEPDWPATECYYMRVPENHAQPAGRVIAFPVVVFRSPQPRAGRAPVLHLGAGGPGGALGLDWAPAVRTLWENHDAFSLQLGRDLWVIDPRGVGLAQPSLNCGTYVDNVLGRLQRNLGMAEEWRLGDQDYLTCIRQFMSTGVELAHYNSLAVVHDIERLRQAARIQRWVLVGVSYAAIYAQFIAREFPATVEAMILDSATFPNVKEQHDFIERTLAPYQALYNYCDTAPGCTAPLRDFEQRLWRLYRHLNDKPMRVDLELSPEGQPIAIVLNGDRFIWSLLLGVYDEQIFVDVPHIITDLEAQRTESIKPYFQNYAYYLLDRSYGDLSADSHDCYETKPFTDFPLIKKLARDLPAGYIRDITLLRLNWPDFCEQMQVGPAAAKLAEATHTAVPTLFLHGELDTITPLQHVTSQQPNFARSRVVSYRLSHDVLSSEPCAETVAARFLNSKQLDRLDTACN